MRSHEIEYRLYGDDMQFVEIELDNGESVIAEAGAMIMMDEDVRMETLFGGSSKGGLFSALGGAAKRVITGESIFITSFTNIGDYKQRVSFASPYPGKIISIDLSKYQEKIICQRDSFLCAAKGVEIGIAFTKKIGAGFFGGEGFILQKIEGDGLVFIHAGGTIVKKTLDRGQKLKVDTGCLVAMTKDINYNIEFVGGIKNTLFGGEGLFFATLTGPGEVWIQSLPFICSCST
ncbi:TIGR00266 family protein [Romboutsia sp.]|uniref:TIGR00266 family protein n=1 Tax=Romboutsia sp. TaxID=1965302 RepID=UPI003F38A425